MSVSKREWVTPDGVPRSAWSVRWKEGGRHRSKGGFRLKKDAEAFSRRVEDDKASGIERPKLRTGTVRVLADEYLKTLEDRVLDGRVARTRLRNVRIACDVSIVPRLGETKLVELTPFAIEQWFVAMVRHDKLAPMTAKSRVQELKLACDFAVRRGFLASNPVMLALKDLGNVRSKPVRTMTLEQVQMVLRTVETRGKWGHARTQMFMRCAVNLAAFCGLRQGEILGLTLANVNFRESVIQVRHSLTHFDELKGPKTQAGNRDVPFPPHVGAMLRQWLDAGFVANERDLVFRSAKGERICASSMTATLWRAVLTRAGLWRARDNFHFHVLRHFAASWWLYNGMPITDTASLMGHAKFDMTLQVYAHPIVGGHRRTEAFERMAIALLPLPAPPPAAV